jgi:hypothetical protein
MYSTRSKRGDVARGTRLEGFERQAWPPWFDTCANTASRLNEAGF